MDIRWAALLRWWEAVTGRRVLLEHLLTRTRPVDAAVAEQAQSELQVAALALTAAEAAAIAPGGRLDFSETTPWMRSRHAQGKQAGSLEF